MLMGKIKTGTGIISMLLFGVMMATLAFSASTNVPAGDYFYLVDIQATNILPGTIYPNDLVSLAVDIKDKGSLLAIKDMNATVTLGNQFDAVQPSDFAQIIEPGSVGTLLFKFRVKDTTPPGYYSVLLTMNYTRNNEPVTETQTITIPVSKSDKYLDVTVSPKSINPGNQSALVFTIRNIGGNSVSNIAFSWTEANGLVLPLGSDNKRYLSYLEPGTSADLNYTIAADPNITPGIYPFSVSLSFSDTNGTITQTSQVGIIVGGGTDFEISAENTSSQVSLSIANIGSNNAGAVVVKIPQQPGITVSGSSTSILGNINKGDYTLASFTLQTQTATDTNIAGGSAARQRFNQGGNFPAGTGTQTQDINTEQRAVNPQDANFALRQNAAASQLLVQIDYTDTTGARQSVQKSVKLSSTSAFGAGVTALTPRRTSGNDQLIPIVLAVVFVLAALGINKFGKKNKPWKKVAIAAVIIAVLYAAVILLFSQSTESIVIATIISVGIIAWLYFKDKIMKMIKKDKK
ncbi:Uncharacterised protein [uncultured archaeon]|nr:Uncharacterised protein [uncultured archaeon]